MINNEQQLAELRSGLRRVMRGLWARRRPDPDLLEGLARRHVGVLAHVGREGPEAMGDIAAATGLSLPAASKLVRDLVEHGLLQRREDPDDRRRTLVELSADAEPRVRAWLERRDRPLEQALAALSAAERDAFLKGLGALADALMEESPCGTERPHHRPPHRRGPHRHRPV
jgi:DNA-binding MarR family transcriptional regulator